MLENPVAFPGRQVGIAVERRLLMNRWTPPTPRPHGIEQTDPRRIEGGLP